VQPLDGTLNKPLKDIVRDIIEDSLDIYKQGKQMELQELQKSDNQAVVEHRVLITWAISEAREWFSLRHTDLIVRTFRKPGLMLHIGE